jgi:predicted amidohydrolase YtcJ
VTALQGSSPEAEAFVMRRQKFLAVGTEAETMRLAGDASMTWRREGRQRRLDRIRQH